MESNSSIDNKTVSNASPSSESLIDLLGGETYRNMVLAYFLLKQSVDVFPGSISHSDELKGKETTEILEDLVREDFISRDQPTRYSLNLGNPAVIKIIKEYFLDGIKKIEKAFEKGDLDPSETYIRIERLSDETDHFEEILSDEKYHFEEPPEISELLDKFTEIYMQLYIAIESEREYQIWIQELVQDKVMLHFLLKQSVDVSFDDLSKVLLSLEREKVDRIITEEYVEWMLIHTQQPDKYSLNIKSPAVKDVLKEFFVGGLERIKTDFANEKNDGSEYVKLIKLERSLNRLEEELGPSEEFSEVDDAFYNLYGEIDMLCELDKEGFI